MLESFETCERLSLGPTLYSALKQVYFIRANVVLFVMCAGNFVECPVGPVAEWMVYPVLYQAGVHVIA